MILGEKKTSFSVHQRIFHLWKAVEAEFRVTPDHDGFVRTTGTDQRIAAKSAFEATKMVFLTTEVKVLRWEGWETKNEMNCSLRNRTAKLKSNIVIQTISTTTITTSTTA